MAEARNFVETYFAYGTGFIGNQIFDVFARNQILRFGLHDLAVFEFQRQ